MSVDVSGILEAAWDLRRRFLLVALPALPLLRSWGLSDAEKRVE